MKITVVGTGYVGLSLAVLLAQKHEVKALDISSERINSINNRKTYIHDEDIEDFFNNKKLNLYATLEKKEAYSNIDYVVVATPTDYDVRTGSFDTSAVESVIAEIVQYKCDATIVIKSTVPMGFTDKMRSTFDKKDIVFSPEFLRESKSLYDNLYPSRIVLGDDTQSISKFGDMLAECSNKPKDEIPIIKMKSIEAEAVKLFSNTYLAMRISFFNELDSFSEIFELSTAKVIEGVSSDPRIGNYYNNPSFGYGGYCLPKDTKQLLENFNDVPNNIIKAVVESNKTRKIFIANSIMRKNPKTIGIYRLVMKNGADNFRDSAIADVIDEIKGEDSNIKILIYEPYLNDNNFKGGEVRHDLQEFIVDSDIIIANRFSKELNDVKEIVYTRDIFNEN